MARSYTRQGADRVRSDIPALRSAESIAERIHATQKRRGGEPYMSHIKEVVDGVVNPEAKMVAYLHDTMEDGGLTVAEMKANGIPDRVIKAVEALTRPPPAEQEMTYQQYIEQIVKPNELARQVKISDLRSNLKDNDNPGQVKRYERALQTLQYVPPVDKNSYKPEYGGQIVMVNPTKILDRLAYENPERDIRLPSTQLKTGDAPRIDLATSFLLKTEEQRKGEKLKGSRMGLEDGELKIADGRHRLVAAERLGMQLVGIEVKKGTAKLYEQFV